MQLLKKIQKASKEAEDLNQRIAGLSKESKKLRMKRLEDFQMKRRDAVAEYYLAKEELERLSFSKSEDDR